MKLLIWGKGGHARVVTQYLPFGTDIFFLDDNDNWKNDKIISKFPPNEWAAFVAIGDNYCRERKFFELEQLGYKMINIYASKSLIFDIALANTKGVFVSGGVIIHIGTQIGNGAILNTNSTIEHDCIIGKFVHIAPGVTLCGNVHVGNRTIIGVGSCVIPGIKISENSIIAGGTSINKDLLKSGFYAGNPVQLKGNIK